MNIEERHKPFLLPYDGVAANGQVEFLLCPELPPLPGDAVEEQWHYYSTSQPDCTWFVNSIEHIPFAMSQRGKSPEQILIYLPESNKKLLSSSNVIMLLLETEALLTVSGGLMAHGCLVDTSKGGILFTGPSGIGKSTQGSLWEAYGQGRILNGDRAGLMKRDGQWQGWGLPFAGSSGVYLNEGCNLRALVLLKQAKVNSLRQLTGVEAFRSLYPQIHLHRWSPAYMEQGTSTLMQLLKDLPVYELSCRPDRDAVELLDKTLFGGL